MEYYIPKKDANGLKAGEKYNVLRNINGECIVLIKDDHTPNVVMDESALKRSGTLGGTPELGG